MAVTVQGRVTEERVSGQMTLSRRLRPTIVVPPTFQWLNRVVKSLPRNGTTQHTFDPSTASDVVSGTAFTPTAGRFLTAVVVCPESNDTPNGWSISEVRGGDQSHPQLMNRQAQGGDTFVVNHGVSNMPMLVDLREYVPGTQIMHTASKTLYGASDNGPDLDANGGHDELNATLSNDFPAGYGFNGVTWGARTGPAPTEITDMVTANSPTTGFWYSAASANDTVTTSWSPATTNDSTRDSHSMILWCIKLGT